MSRRETGANRRVDLPGSEVVRAWDCQAVPPLDRRRSSGGEPTGRPRSSSFAGIVELRESSGFYACSRLPESLRRSRATPDQACVVTTYVEGESGTGQNDLAQLAAALAELHRVDRSAVDLSFLPRLADGPAQHEILFHGDFWPGNTLWRAGRLVALIDWEDAAVGDPLADLANGRLEVLFAFGEDAMDGFTDAYRAEMSELDYGDLPRWDLFAVRRLLPEIPNWGLDHAKEEELRRRSEWFAARAATWS